MMNDADVFIKSADLVKEELDGLLEKPPKTKEIHNVMKEDLGMRYRKVVGISVHANSEKNLVLRQ